MPHQQQFAGREYRDNEQTFIDGGSFSNNLAQSLLAGSNFHSEILPQAAMSARQPILPPTHSIIPNSIHNQNFSPIRGDGSGQHSRRVDPKP